jgi:hypothetical protein
MKKLSERLRDLEQLTNQEELPSMVIEVINEDETEVFTESNGKKTPLTETEQQKHIRRFRRDQEPMNIDIVIGEWDL